jgi:hypothetical protein
MDVKTQTNLRFEIIEGESVDFDLGPEGLTITCESDATDDTETVWQTISPAQMKALHAWLGEAIEALG